MHKLANFRPKPTNRAYGEDAADAIKRQFHSSAGNAYALWAIEIEKTAVTLEMMEQRIDNQWQIEVREELIRPEQK
jgi:hypothetical protein